MLKGISPLISPDLLSTLARMGHGDEIVLADAFFPGETMAKRCLRADGLKIAPLMDAILSLISLDQYVESPISIMAPVAGDSLDQPLMAAYADVIERRSPGTAPAAQIERFAFYERAKSAFAVVMTGETVKYGNIILKKGVC
jgi:L-fucose mutarotase